MRVSKFKVQKMADALGQSVTQGDNWVTLNYGPAHFVRGQLGADTLSPLVWRVTARVMDSVLARYPDFWWHSQWNMQAESREQGVDHG